MLASELLKGWLPECWRGRRLLVAVSGGADSVALLCGLVELAEAAQVHAAHFNHHWRGQESDGDQAFVVKLCERLGVPLSLGQPGAGSQRDIAGCRENAMLAKGGFKASEETGVQFSKTEEAARDERYSFLIRSAYACGASYVVTAHTADDRVETTLHNLFRGSGLNGIASLKQFRALHDDLVLVRPLLAITRVEIESFLKARGQLYRTDSSNESTHYARNYIRRLLLPHIKERYPQAAESVLRFSELMEATVEELDEAAERWLEMNDRDVTALVAVSGSDKLPERWQRGDYWVGNRQRVSDWPWSIVRQALRQVWLERGWPLVDMSQSHWLSIRQHVSESPAADAAPGITKVHRMLPGSLSLESHGAWWAIGRPSESSQPS